MYERFLKEKRYLTGCTEKTISIYAQSLRRLGVESPNQQALTDFVIRLREDGLKPSAINSYARSINSYLSWKGQSERIKLLKSEKRVFRTFNEKELKAIVSFKPTTVGEKRIHTLILTLLDCGLRVSEGLTLLRSKVDFDNLLIIVNGKGGKQRVIPMSVELRKILYKFLQTHTHELVFCTRQGNKLTYDNVRRDFHSLMHKLCIDPDGSFHALRRSFAVGFVRSGGNVFALQRFLGHATLTQTRTYVELSSDDLSLARSGFSMLK